jgi:U3 small nucleolar RNA-associated protein 18
MKLITITIKSAITSLQIHPSLPLLIASGPSSKMDLYHLHNQPPDYASQLTSLVVKATALTTTAFHPHASDPRIFLSARRRYFHVWNLATGQVSKISRVYGHRDEQQSMERFKVSPDGAHVAFLGSSRKGGGVINVLAMDTLQWVAQARVEARGGIAEFAWWSDSSGLCIAGKDGAVTEWSLQERRAVARWQDEGGVGTTIIALGGRSGRKDLGGDAWIALGSSGGIVNIYSRRAWFADRDAAELATDDNSGVPPKPKPTRTLDQLTTPTSHLSFSPDGQLLVMASRWKKDALRLVHLPSCAIYRNWPTANTPFGRISAVCWGEVNGTLKLVVGNEAGRVMCWEVRD